MSPEAGCLNWHWLEDLLVRACEAEVLAFAAELEGEPVFAFCLEFEGLAGAMNCSYGTRAAVESRVATLRRLTEARPVYYRALELRPENWRYRRQPLTDRDGAWERADALLDRYRQAVAGDGDPDGAEFYWMRFEYLAECVVRRLIDRSSLNGLPRERDFLAYAGHEDESLEELEDRLERLYPGYRRATVELVRPPRLGSVRPRRCQGPNCEPRATSAALRRCTYCQTWLCELCGAAHAHPELFNRLPFFGG